MYQYSEEEKDEIWDWSFAGSIFSYVGFAFIFLSFICISNLRKRLPIRMLMNLAGMGMILTVSGILTVDAEEFDAKHHNLCVCVGFIRNFTLNSSILWSLMFAVTMSDYIFKEARYNIESRNYVIAYGLPLILAFIPLFMDYYGDATIYCWINKHNNHTLSVDFVFSYLPPVIVLIALFFYYIRMYLRLRNTSLTKDDRKLLLQFFLHPLSMLLSFIFPTVNRFYNIPFQGGKLLWMMKLHVLCLQSIVMVNALVFGTNRMVWVQIEKAINSLRCLKRQRSITNEPKYYSIDSMFISKSLKSSLAEPKERRVSRDPALMKMIQVHI